MGTAILHRRKISPGEDEEKEVVLLNFEVALDDLVRTAQECADEIGGYFRAPGIYAELREIVLAKANRSEWQQ